jgi:lactobin A/cerein 7B family class IIb bacteriocin
MTIKVLQDSELENVSGGAGKGVVTNYGGTPTVGDYTQGRVQDLSLTNANSKAFSVSSSTGSGTGQFILNPWNPQTNTFF